MANVYVDSAAAGAGTGADWANAYTTLAAATAAKAAGDDFWVASSHSETKATLMTITFPGASATPNRCISVNKAGSVPPVAADILAGAVIATTVGSSININGFAYIYGITFNCGTGNNACLINIPNSSGYIIADTCALNIVNTSSGGAIGVLNGSGCATELINTTVSFGATTQSITFQSASGWFSWRNKSGSTGVTGATIPTKLFVMSSSGAVRAEAVVDGVDLSALGSGTTLVDANEGAFKFTNCKLGTSVTIANTPVRSFSRGTRVIGCGTTTNVERNEIYLYQGTLTTETTIIRTAGASDGTTAYSWKVVTTANAKRTFPFETFEGAVWNTTLSSQTLTVHCVTDNVTLTDAEIWVEVEYLASGATPVSTLITDANATVLTTPANQTSDSGEAWTTTGLGTPVKQALAVTFTPAMVGPIRWKVKVAKASTTVYIDPNVDIA